ncbi:MATH domain and coiled-coil domain-containing protein [Cardamine amara subsp. amara]|uniref:MATH domain and coiled-coil domain-containing protein n=1 Tax=Cardamine amara subsp. amara TaxID=228776 RepID=A0ABD1AC86_CARAN
MLKKAKRYVLSDSDSDSDSLLDTSSDDDDEIVKVNGFHVLVSQVNQVKEMFNKHPGLSLNFNVKNKQLKSACMDVLLDLISTLCQSAKEHSLKDLNKADTALLDLTRAGLKVGWLRQKLDDAYLKKEKQRASGAWIRELEEQVKKRKLALSNLESDLKKEKAAALAAKARIGFSDIV